MLPVWLQAAIPSASSLIPLANNMSNVSVSSSAGPWTSVMLNGLFVPSPAKSASLSSVQDLQHHTVICQPWTDDQLEMNPTAGMLSPVQGSSLEMFSGSDDRDSLTPASTAVAAAEPWLELQDAALQQVLGVSLQQLQCGGQQVRC